MHPSFIVGFVKRAQENGFSQPQALHLFKEAFDPELYAAKTKALDEAGALKSLQTPTIPAIPASIPASIPEPVGARADELANWFKANPNANLDQLEAQTNHLMARPQLKN